MSQQHSFIPHHFRRAFTLIELLVVIAIIGILSSVAVASIDYARMKARDTRAINDMRAIHTALTAFADHHGGKYPAQTAVPPSSNSSPNPNFPIPDPNPLAIFNPNGPLIPKYINPIKGPKNSYWYQSSSYVPFGGIYASAFVLCYALEATTPAEYVYCIDNNGIVKKQNSGTPCRMDVDVGASRYNCTQ